jgi:AraC family transcriptional regulator, transcriptional activator of pobA
LRNGGTRFPVVALAPARAGSLPVRVRRRENGCPMHVPGFHAHRFFVLVFVVRGKGTLELLDGSLELGTGDIHLLFPGEVHDTRGLGDVRGWVVEFTADALGDEAGNGYFGLVDGRPRWVSLLHRSGPRGRRVSVRHERRKDLATLFANLERELVEAKLGHREAARARLQIALLDVLREALPEGGPGALSPLVQQTMDVVDQRYREPLSLKDVARAVGRSGAHVAEVLRRETGMSVLEWIAERRMEDARRRLRDTDEDVAIVGERIGYGSTNHFIRQFRRVHGTTPGSWRRLVQRVASEA